MIVAFIPVRGGSKSIPLKNIKMIAGKPLIYWALKAAQDCNKIDKVFVSTDSLEICNVVNSLNFNKAVLISRSYETATDIATTESAMLEFAEKYNFDHIVLLQATSPLTTSADLENGILKYCTEKYDSLLSVVKQKKFIWQINDKGFAEAKNYNYFIRPRRQEFDGFYVENGAFYITSRKNLLKYKNRLSGNIGIFNMDNTSYYEIDEPDDFIILEQLLKQKNEF
jgi:CMP-N-acetylneuraminic acid synthetase